MPHFVREATRSATQKAPSGRELSAKLTEGESLSFSSSLISCLSPTACGGAPSQRGPFLYNPKRRYHTMNKKQKKTLLRIIIAAILTVALGAEINTQPPLSHLR